MTIACGLVCWDGLILCADTQITADYKQHGVKVWLFTKGDVSVVVSGAGDYVLLKLAAEQIGVRLRNGMDINAIRHGVVERVLSSVYADHVNKAPDWAQQSGYDVALIVGICAGKTCQLFESSRTSLAPTAAYRCMGSGSPVGNYIAGNLFSSSLPVLWGQVCAAYLIQQTKAYGLDCGGETHIAVIPREGQARVLSASRVADLEIVANQIHERLGGVLFAAADYQGKGFRENIQKFFDAVKNGHDAILHEYVREHIAKQRLQQGLAAPPTPKPPTRDRKSRKPSPE